MPPICKVCGLAILEYGHGPGVCKPAPTRAPFRNAPTPSSAATNAASIKFENPPVPSIEDRLLASFLGGFVAEFVRPFFAKKKPVTSKARGLASRKATSRKAARTSRAVAAILEADEKARAEKEREP